MLPPRMRIFMPAWLSILGIGEEGVSGLAGAARALLAGAAHVFGGARHLALAETLIAGIRHPWPHPLTDALPEILTRRGEAVAVLASGDPFCFGIGSLLTRHVTAEEFLCLPAPSAFSLACAALGWPMQEVGMLSFCGRPLARLRPFLQPGARLLLLSADAQTPAAIAAMLAALGFGPSRMRVLEALGGPRARIRDFAGQNDIDPLNLVALEVRAGPEARPMPLAAGLEDELFEHDGQITKREIRAVTLSSLAPLAGGVLWDVGAGAGSIGIEWMLRHQASRAIAIEPRPERAARCARNAAALGVPELAVMSGRAPDALSGLPIPDAVFLGGGASDPRVIETAWAALRPGGRMVANSVTLETDGALAAALDRHGGTLTRIGIERLDRIGGLRGFRPAMTVTQWAATKP